MLQQCSSLIRAAKPRSRWLASSRDGCRCKLLAQKTAHKLSTQLLLLYNSGNWLATTSRAPHSSSVQCSRLLLLLPRRATRERTNERARLRDYRTLSCSGRTKHAHLAHLHRHRGPKGGLHRQSKAEPGSAHPSPTPGPSARPPDSPLEPGLICVSRSRHF